MASEAMLTQRGEERAMVAACRGQGPETPHQVVEHGTHPDLTQHTQEDWVTCMAWHSSKDVRAA